MTPEKRYLTKIRHAAEDKRVEFDQAWLEPTGSGDDASAKLQIYSDDLPIWVIDAATTRGKPLLLTALTRSGEVLSLGEVIPTGGTLEGEGPATFDVGTVEEAESEDAAEITRW